MGERTCPFMTRPRVTRFGAENKEFTEAMRILCPQDDECQAWSKELGDCKMFVTAGDGAEIVRLIFEGLEKFQKPDRCKEMWEKMKKWCGDDKDYAWIRVYMDKIEAEMGKE